MFLISLTWVFVFSIYAYVLFSNLFPFFHLRLLVCLCLVLSVPTYLSQESNWAQSAFHAVKADMLCVFQLQDEYIKIRDQTRKSRGIQVKSKMGEYRQQLGNKELKRRLGNNVNLFKFADRLFWKANKREKEIWCLVKFVDKLILANENTQVSLSKRPNCPKLVNSAIIAISVETAHVLWK